MNLRPRRIYEWLLALLLAATVFTFVCRSSAVVPLFVHTETLRWEMLLAVWVLALLYAACWGSRLPLLRTGAILGTALVALAVVSSGWSVDPHLTVGRSATVGILFSAAVALAAGSAGRPESVRTLFLGLLGGAVAVAFAGVVVLAVSHADAVQPASTQYGSRYRGLGQNPNTVPALLCVLIPANVAFLLASRRRFARAAAFAVLASLDGSIVASGSRGAMMAGFAGSLVLVFAFPGAHHRQAAIAAVVAAVFVLNLLLTQVSAPNAGRPKVTIPTRTRDAERILPLDAEIGRGRLDRPPPRIRRSLFGSSGRRQAWGGAVSQAADRPALGYGFGTESKVFVDRYFYFTSASPENSYLGLLLQLGATGLLVFLALIAALLAGVKRAFELAPERLLVAAGAGGLVAGLVLALVQSYLLSVGNVATASVWICACLACAQIAGARLVRPGRKPAVVMRRRV